MTASLFQEAIAHHIWATEQVIDRCADLTPEQLATPAHGTYGPIIDTLRHLVRTDIWYLTFFPVEQPAPIEENAEPSLVELRSAITRNGALWAEVLGGAHDGDEETVEHGEGWKFYAPVGLRLAQVVHHGTDHRSQVCTALTSLGLAPPEIDLWAYGEATGRTRGEYLERPAQ